MTLDTRWKNPQGKSPEQLHDAIVQIVRELRKGDYLPVTPTPTAADISYSNTTSGLTATDVQAAIDENDGRLDTLEATTPGLVLLNSGTVTNQATLPIVLTSFTAYRGLQFELINLVPATDDVELWMRLSTNGGSSYDAGAGNYRYTYIIASESGLAQQSSSSDTKIRIGGQVTGSESVSNTAAEGGVSATVKLFNQAAAGVWPNVDGRARWLGASGAGEQSLVNGYRVTAQDTDAVQFLFESGNISSGKWALYGYA